MQSIYWLALSWCIVTVIITCEILITKKSLLAVFGCLFNLDLSVRREQAVLYIGVQRTSGKFVITLLVMRCFSSFLSASTACADFHDSTIEFRFDWSPLITIFSNPSIGFTLGMMAIILNAVTWITIRPVRHHRDYLLPAVFALVIAVGTPLFLYVNLLL